MRNSVALIGFMGAGKSVVARLLSSKLGKTLVETDILIKQRAGKSIAAIFKEDGEARFRQLEKEVTEEIARKDNQVIACGGGLILNKANVDSLKEKAVIVYLTATPEVLLKRVSRSKTVRPLLSGHDRKNNIRKLLEFRQPLYEDAADIVIDTSDLTVKNVATTIIDRINKHESSD